VRRRRAGVVVTIMVLLGLITTGTANASPIYVGLGVGRVNAETYLNNLSTRIGRPANVVCEPHYYRLSTLEDPNIVLDSSRRDDTREHIIHHPQNNGASQIWVLCHTNVPIEAPDYFLLVLDTGGCADLKDWADYDGAPFVERQCTANDNQRFWMIRDPVTGSVAFQVKVHGGRFMYGDPYFNVPVNQYSNKATLYRLNPVS
jgi:hypothetical protein